MPQIEVMSSSRRKPTAVRNKYRKGETEVTSSSRRTPGSRNGRKNPWIPASAGMTKFDGRRT
ncbi:MAG TPA: hypothetical protein VFW68_15360, partial [Rhodocyclaceae bacterium]|nr:hypothetical protein [Rhodocyclaceae bacterium]